MLQILVAISQKFCCSQKRHGAMQKLFIKKKKEKNGQVSKILKTMGTQMPTSKRKEKEEMNKIAHVFLQSCF